MKQNNKLALLIMAMVFINSMQAQDLVHYWNFNTLPSGTLTSVTPDSSIIPAGAAITYPGTGAGYLDNVNPGSTVNAQNGDAAGLGLRPRNPSDSRSLDIAFSTAGYKDIVVNFATARTTQGATEQTYSYSIDGGSNFITTGLAITSHSPSVEPTYTNVELDFTGITGVENNSSFILRINFGGITASGSSGNNRFDNITVEGSPMAQSELIHYWNFNSLPSGTLTTVTPDVSVVPTGTAITYPGTGAGYMDNVNPGSAINARNADAAGLGLRPRNPSDSRELLIAANTTGYENIVINFATTKTNNGATEQQYDYSIDGGANYTTTGLSFTSHSPTTEPNYSLVTIDLSAIATVKNNAGFIFRVKFGGSAASGSSGNNRFDNITVEGTPISGGLDVTPPLTTFNPANNATGVAVATTPTITFNEDVRLINNSLIDDNNVDALVELRQNNAAGALVPFNATFANHVITITPSASLQNNQQYYVALLANTVEDLNDNAIASIRSASFTTSSLVFSTKVAFATDFVVVNEDAGNATINLILTSPATASVDVVVKGTPFSTADASDINFATQTLNFTPGSSTTQTITIPIVNDTLGEQAAEYFVLSLENPVGLNITGTTLATIYIKDNDRLAPRPTKDIELKHLTSFDPSGASSSTCEIVVHDSASQRLFTTSAIAGYLDIIDFSNPVSLSLITSVNMNPFGGVTSVAVKNGIVAVASPNADEQQNGSVVFFNTNGVFLKQVTVGALPDMITFSPDGKKVLTANEGQPNLDYTIDPEGSVSIIDVSGGVANLSQANVTTLLFTAFNAQESALKTAGIRKLKSTSTLSQDFEPEYITISDDSKKAWVTLQENNAIAEIDLQTNTYTGIWALGTKDYHATGSGFDASDNNGQVLIANWPVKAFHIPDAIAQYTAGGNTYLVTANEGDEKEYNGLNERTTVGAGSYILDPVKFPNADVLKKSHNLGRFRVTNLNGDTDNDGDIDEIYCVGTRSFTIWDAATKTRVYDSGDDFELYTSTDSSVSAIFNADHGDNIGKGRSRAKGPEPEGVALANISGKTYSFVSLERVGGVMVYDVSDPAHVVFADYKNTRSTTAYSGDHGAEGIYHVKGNQSPTGKDYILVANEISGTITVFEVVNNNPNILMNAITPTTYCAGDSITISFAATNSGNQFEIILSDALGNFPGTNLGTTAASPFKGVIPVSSASGNSYELKINATGAQVESNTRPITVNGLPVVNLGNDTTLCNGSTLRIQSPAFSSYGWSTGATTAFIDVTTTNTYTLTVTDDNNCQNSDAVAVTFDICSGLDNIIDGLSVSVYPNPAESILNISVQQGSGFTNIKLMSVDGKVLMEDKHTAGEFTTSLQVQALPAGLYLLHVRNTDTARTIKIIIQ